MKNFITIQGLRCRYEEKGSGKSIILIHGWGQSIDFWHPLDFDLSQKYKVYTLDLPGFGKSSEPQFNWDINDYAKFIRGFAQNFSIGQPIIIGHSFGGRVAAIYAALYGCRKLILYSASGIPRFSLGKEIFKLLNIVFKPFFPNQLYQLYCSLYKPGTYHNAITIRQARSRRMVDIYLNINDDLTDIFTKIKVDTLLIYGRKDSIVSFKVGQGIHRLIFGSRIRIIEKCSHFAHIEQTDTFENLLFDWLKS